MHVCHMCDSSLEGDYFRNIAAGMSRKGVRVSLVELGAGKPPAWLSTVPGTDYTALGAAGKIGYLLAVRRLASYLEKEGVDILHTHLFYSGLVGVLSKRLRPKTIVALMRHHTGVVRMLGSGLHVRGDKWMADRADHVLTVSEAAREYMHEVDNISRDIDVVHLGFDFERFAPDRSERQRIRREFGIKDKDFAVGYVANFARGKGHVELIEAFQTFVSAAPDAKLLFAGRGQLSEVTEAAAKLPKDKVIFAGWRSDIPAVLNAFDVFVQPSLSEAFSQVIIEAMGVGLPVIATDVGGAREVIESGVNGILVEPGDPPAIAQQLSALYSDMDLRAWIAEAGMHTVKERFTVGRMVDEQFRLYQKWMTEGH